MSAHASERYLETEELFDLECLARSDSENEEVVVRKADVIGLPGQPAGLLSVDEKLYQRFGEEFEAPAYENLSVEEELGAAAEVLER